MHEYSTILFDSIEREKSGIDYRCNDNDRDILLELFRAINLSCGTNIRYIAEIDHYSIPGAAEIIAKYIDKLSSQSLIAYLLPNLADKTVNSCDKLVIELYRRFKKSDEYIPKPGSPASAHIYVRYDNAIRQLKPKRLKQELLQLSQTPRDFFYLPFTMKMLASWKLQEFEETLHRYAVPNCVSPEELGIADTDGEYSPSFPFIYREIRFSAIQGLRNYPSENTLKILEMCVADNDVDIQDVAKTILKKIS